jgi:chromosome segregation ATPase
MTKTNAKARIIEGIERELEEVQGRLAEMRSELKRLQEVPEISWDGVSEETVNELAEAEKQRLTLPHLIGAGEIKELELRLELAKARQPEAQRETVRCYDTLQIAKEKLREAEDEYNAASIAHGDAMERERDLKGEVHRLSKEIPARKATAQREWETLTAPVVRSVWQQQTRERV